MATTPEDLTKWTVAQLKAELGKNSLETRGVKGDLVARLTNFRQLTAKLELETSQKEEEPETVEESVTNGDADASIKEEETEEVEEEKPEETGADEAKEEQQEEEAAPKEEPIEQDTSVAMITLDDVGEEFQEETPDQDELNASTASTVGEKTEEGSTEAAGGRTSRHQLIQESRTTRRSQSFYLYPVSPDELDGADLKPYLVKCVHIHYKCLSFGLRGEKLMGCLELQLKTSEDVVEVEESLKNWKESVRVVRLRPTDENICDIVADLVGYPGSAPARQDLRTLVIRNLPEGVLEDKMEELFPGCNVTLGQNTEGKLTGNAFLEFVTVDEVQKALEKCKDLEVEGTKLEAALMNQIPGGPRDWTDKRNMTLQKPLPLNNLKKVVNQVVKLRIMIATHWQDTSQENQIKQNLEKLEVLENRLEQNATLRRQRHMTDPDMWRRLRHDWLRKPSTAVDRNHQHLIPMGVPALKEKLQKKLERRQDRQNEKKTGKGEKEADKSKTEEKKTEGEAKKEGEKSAEKKPEGEKKKEGGKDDGKKKDDAKKTATTGDDKKDNKGAQNRKRGRGQRDVQGRNLTVTVSNNMGGGGTKRVGSRGYDSSSPTKRFRQDRSPMASGGMGNRSQNRSFVSGMGNRPNRLGMGNRGNQGSMSSGNRGMMGSSGNYGNQNRGYQSGNFNRGGNYNNNQGGMGGMGGRMNSGGGGGGNMGGDFSSGNQMGMQGMQSGMGNRSMGSNIGGAVGGGGGGGGQDTSNALNLLVGLSQMLSKSGGAPNLAAAAAVPSIGSIGGYNNQGSGDFRSSSSSLDVSGGYGGGRQSGFYDDRQGGMGSRMSDLDQRPYDSLSRGGTGSSSYGGGSRYGGGSSGRW